MTSRHGDHAAACLKELSLLFKLLVIEKSLSFMAKYDLNINKPGIFAIHFYFLYFFNANDDNDIFFNNRIRFLVRSRLVPCIDSVSIPELGDFENIFYSYLKMNRHG